MKNKLFFLTPLICWLIFFSLTAAAQTADRQIDKRIDAAEKTNRTITPANFIQIVDFSGAGTDEIFPNNQNWSFFGPTKKITVNGSQRVIGSGSAVFGTYSGTSRISVSICYQQTGGVINSFAGNNHLIADADSLRRTFAVTVTAAPAAGTYSVGYCIINNGTQTLGNNDYVNGWVMVID